MNKRYQRKIKRRKQAVTIFISDKVKYLSSIDFNSLHSRLGDPSIFEVFEEGKSFNRDHLLIFLAYIQYRYLILYSNIEATDDCVSLSSKYIQDVLKIPKATHYYKILNQLGILDIKNPYEKGKKSFSYSFTEEYLRVDKLTPVMVNHFSFFGNEPLVKGYDHLNKWLDSNCLKNESIDIALDFSLKRAIEHLEIKRGKIERYFREQGNSIVLQLLDKLYVEELNSIYNSISSQYLLLRFIELGYIRKNIDKTSSRLHTNVTNLKKDFRKLLRYQDSQGNRHCLVGVDIKNSQPYMSLILFDDRFYRLLLGERFNKADFFLGQSYFKETHKRLKSVLDCGFLENFRSKLKNQDVLDYINLVSNGMFYDKMLEYHGNDILENQKANTQRLIGELTARTITEYFDCSAKEKRRKANKRKVLFPYLSDLLAIVENKQPTRDDVKTMIFLTFFSKNRFKGDMPGAYPKEIFRKRFPTVSELFEKIKSGSYKINGEEKGHNLLAVLLQQIESYLVLKCITYSFARDRNQNLPMFTIHDSILTIKGEHEYVRNKMERSLFEYTGQQPTLEYERLETGSLIER